MAVFNIDKSRINCVHFNIITLACPIAGNGCVWVGGWVGGEGKTPLRRRQLKFFVVRAVERIISGRSVGKIIMILSFRVGTSKNTNIEHRVKETCDIMSTQVTYYEIDHISLLRNSTISSALNFCFLCILS